MLSLVLATSNAPALVRDISVWPRLHEAQSTPGIPSPNELLDETMDVLAAQQSKIQEALAVLSDRLEKANPDAILVLGYDDGTCFGPVQTPQFCTYTGQKLEGSCAVRELGEDPRSHWLEIPCADELAQQIHAELVDREIDMSYMAIQNSLGHPEWGTSSAFTRPMSWLNTSLPIIPIFINAHQEPTPSGARCHALGRALAGIIDSVDAKIAVLAVGGMSHDPKGPRAGWIDERLDRFFLGRLCSGDGDRLRDMFNLDSDTVRGGTGELRTWLTAAAIAESAGRKARLVDYIPSLHAMAGLGFAYWPNKE